MILQHYIPKPVVPTARPVVPHVPNVVIKKNPTTEGSTEDTTTTYETTSIRGDTKVDDEDEDSVEDDEEDEDDEDDKLKKVT